ncbi:MAG: CARDB domain-containing protein [Planctomycetota bacterium]
MRADWSYRRLVAAVVWVFGAWLCLHAANQTVWSQEGAGKEDFTQQKKQKVVVPKTRTGPAQVQTVVPGTIQIQQPGAGATGGQPATPTPGTAQPPATMLRGPIQITPGQVPPAQPNQPAQPIQPTQPVQPAQPGVRGFPTRQPPWVQPGPTTTTPPGQPSGRGITYPLQPAWPPTQRETAPPPQTRGGGCDLCVEDVQATPASVAQGNPVLVRAVISNRSGVAVANAPVRFSLGAAQMGDDEYVNIGAFSSILVKKMLPAEKPGACAVRVWVDPENVVPEVNETNNVREVGILIGAAPREDVPPERGRERDLAVQEITVSPSPCVLGEDARIQAIISNRGNEGLQGVRVRFRMENTIIGRDLAVSIGPRQNAALSAALPGELTAKVGARYAGRSSVSVQVDPENQIAEADEENNCAEAEFRVHPRDVVRLEEAGKGTTVQPPMREDLSDLKPAVPSDSIGYTTDPPNLICKVEVKNGAYIGDGKSVKVQVTNVGGFASPAFSVGVCSTSYPTLANDANWPTVKWLGIADMTVDMADPAKQPLQPKETRTITVSLQAPVETMANWNTLVFYAVVDIHKTVAEGTQGEKTNNISNQFKYAIARPDLFCEVAVTNGVYTGDGKGVDVKVGNKGNAPSDSFTVGLCRADQAKLAKVPWMGEALVQVTPNASLNPGETRLVKVPWKSPDTAQMATPKAGIAKPAKSVVKGGSTQPKTIVDNILYVAMVDSYNVVVEGDISNQTGEQNNLSNPFKQTTVVPPSSLTVLPIKDAVEIKNLKLSNSLLLYGQHPVLLAEVVGEDEWAVQYYFPSTPSGTAGTVAAQGKGDFPTGVELPSPWKRGGIPVPTDTKVKVVLTAWNQKGGKDQKHVETELAKGLYSTDSITIKSVKYTWRNKGDGKVTTPQVYPGWIPVDDIVAIEVMVDINTITTEFTVGDFGHPMFGSLYVVCGIRGSKWHKTTGGAWTVQTEECLQWQGQPNQVFSVTGKYYPLFCFPSPVVKPKNGKATLQLFMKPYWCAPVQGTTDGSVKQIPTLSVEVVTYGDNIGGPPPSEIKAKKDIPLVDAPLSMKP